MTFVMTKVCLRMPTRWAWTDGTAYGVDVLRGEVATDRWHAGEGGDSGCGRWGWTGSGDWDDASRGAVFVSIRVQCLTATRREQALEFRVWDDCLPNLVVGCT